MTTEEQYDVIVVGAGPSGCMAAKYAAKNGARTLLIEEHAQIGSPVQCAGLISVRAMNECEVDLDSSFVLQKIKGAFIYAPNGQSIKIGGSEVKSYVIERKIFDRLLAKNALKNGADILLKTKVIGLKNNNNNKILKVLCNGLEKNIKTKIVIGADGITSKIAKLCGLGQVKKILSGVQIEASYKCDPEFVEVFTGKYYANGFFAWTVPINEDIARIGLCINSINANPQLRNAHSSLLTLLNNHPIVSKKYKFCITDFVVGGIPIGTLKNTVADGVMIVGDAAGQVKPTSGGGIYPSAVCAKIAGEVAAKSILNKEVSAKRLYEYEKIWRSTIGRELAIGMKIHNAIFKKLRDSDLNKLIALIKDSNIVDLINKYGDMDHPSLILQKLITANFPKRQIMKILLKGLILR